MATSFDTLQAARDLEAAGLDLPQAEAIAQVVRQGQSELATKADIAALETSAKADLEALKIEVKADIAAASARLETSMLKLAFGIVAANTALIVGLLKLL